MQKLLACCVAAAFACGETPVEPPPPPPPLALSTMTLADGRLGQPYSKDLEATGGKTPYVFSLKEGTLQAGLQISGSKLSGTPTAPGKKMFTLSVKDALNAEVTRAFELYIAPDALVVTTSSLSSGTETEMYTSALEATGGIGPYAWRVSTGMLPDGLTLDADGTISGEPTTAGATAFTVQITDSEMKSATRELMLTIRPLLPMIATTTLTRALLQSPYEDRLVVMSGHAPFTWSLAMGALPRGVGLDTGSGVIAGRPLETGVFRFTVRVTDDRMRTDEVELALVVLQPLAITQRNIPNVVLNVAYSQQITATGGLAPYQWFIVGNLPPGLTFVDGLISGAATMVGTYPITVRVQDETGALRSQMYMLVVDDVVVVTSTMTGVAFPPVCETNAPRVCLPWLNTVCTSTDVSYQSVFVDVPSSIAIANISARVDVSFEDRGRSYNAPGNAAADRNLRLKLRLVAPDGRAVILCGNDAGDRINSDRGGCSGSNGVVATFPGTMMPDNSLTRFNGMNPQGRWYLQVIVAWPTVDNSGVCHQAGTINAFELTIDRDESPADYTVITGFTYNNLIRDPWVRISGGNQVPNNQIQLVATRYSVGPNGIREGTLGDDIVLPTAFTWSGVNLPTGTTVDPDGTVTGGPETGDAQVQVSDGVMPQPISRRLRVIPPDWNRKIRVH